MTIQLQREKRTTEELSSSKSDSEKPSDVFTLQDRLKLGGSPGNRYKVYPFTFSRYGHSIYFAQVMGAIG